MNARTDTRLRDLEARARGRDRILFAYASEPDADIWTVDGEPMTTAEINATAGLVIWYVVPPGGRIPPCQQ